MAVNDNRKRIVGSVMVVGVLAVAGLFVWQALQERANAAKTEAQILKSLSKKEVQQVVKSAAKVDPPAIRKVVGNTGRRKRFLSGLREQLALAAQARREGYADLEDFRINFEYKKDILLADLYRAKLSEGKHREFAVSPEKVEKILKDPANVEAFNKVMDALQRIRVADAKAKGTFPPQKLYGEALSKAKDNWARTKFLSEMARKDKAFLSSPEIPLRIKILEAGILAADYLRAYRNSFEVTEDEIRQYLKQHPQYDVRRKLKLAQAVLAKARAGEDFSRLASEYSEDNLSKARGGLYQDMAPGSLWPEVEQAASGLEKGEMYDGLIESKDGFHLLVLVDKQEKKKSVRLTVKQILIQKRFREPGGAVAGVPRPFMTPEEIAAGEMKKRKRKEFVEEIVRKNPISMPEDFELAFEEVAESADPGVK